MLMLRQTDRLDIPAPAWGLRMLAVAASPGRLVLALTAQGAARVETETCLFDAVETLECDATGFAAVVVDCDGFGGLAAARQVLGMLGRVRERIGLALAAAEVVLPEVAPRPGAPVLLRTPVTAGALRAGLGHLLRDRLVMAPIDRALGPQPVQA
jgi:hypothetical protein